MLKDRQEYSFEDFVSDDDFIAWVKYPNSVSNTFWSTFIAENPAKEITIQEAKDAIEQLAIASRKTAPESDVPKIWDKLGTTTHFNAEIKLTPRFSRKVWTAAASVLLALGVSFGLFFWNNAVTKSAYAQQTSHKSGLLKEIVNTTQAELKFNLPDGSKITLKPNSKISYDPYFTENSREVFLLGEAFFNVQKNPEKPFIVYANGLVTKALGTSFWIKAFENDENVTVKVRTGKVAVYSGKSPVDKGPEISGLVLLPNQQVEFGTTADKFVRTLVEKPAILTPVLDSNQFAFSNASAVSIFERLEAAYGVELIYDKELLINCRLTTTLADESLFEKLDIICAAIEANYKIIDAEIIISSKGCK